MENKVYKTKSVVEAGIISAIIVVLMIITGYVPFLTFAGTLILPVPVALLFLRHELKITFLAILVSTIISSILFNPIQAIFSALSFSLIGLVLGYAIKKEKNYTFTISLLAVISLIATVLTTVLTVMIIQKTSLSVFLSKFINDLTVALKQSIDLSKSINAKMGLSTAQMAQLDTFYAMLTPELFINMGAAALIMGAFMSAIINYIVAKAIMKRFGYILKNIKPFKELYINSFAGALIIAPVPLGVYLQAKNIAIGKPILISGQLIMQYVFVVIGISVVAYFLKQRFKLTNGRIALICIAAFLIPIFAEAFLYIGLADMMFDFRKINPDRVLKK